ncbi:hypothetical protein DTL21_02390 [Bremerella cremea]|uniref:Zinc-finger domain-containing protein n=1 Tax=Blastopirellula marina TaxID=124 RepID=A0A2S8G584_9BACT|nr:MULTISPECIES: hypothetical protein [Pirellulaceae]PQO39615.1 hypothetical protein C5Y83_02390 [Blastopirellula marina]RCS51082.1 hypothetical protein DTL21_02390 [Bremerella cremea]
MSLQLNDELLSAFLDGEVSAEERRQIEVMLAASPEWQKRYRQMVEAVNLVRTLPEETLPRDFSQGILAQIAQRQQVEQSGQNVSPDGTSPAPVHVAPQVVVATPAERSQSKRIRRKPSAVSPAWLALAACVVVAIGLGIAIQAGMFDGDQTPVAVDNQDANPVQDPTAALATNTDPLPINNQPAVDVKPESSEKSPFPDVNQFANDNNSPLTDQPAMDNADKEKPSGFRIRVRTRPGNTKPTPETMVRPPTIARSVYNLEKQDDLGLDRSEMVAIDDANTLTELVNWIDADQDSNLSDSEMQQAWFRFSKPDMQAPAISDASLKLIDRDMNEKISAAEFNLVIASVRWSSSEAIRRIWFRLDANGDGVWSPSDFASNARFAPIQTEVVQWHSLLDRSRNGSVSRIEYVLSAGQMQLTLKNWEQKLLNPRVYDETQKLVAEFDRDGNSQLAGRELRRLRESREDLKSLLENIDQDGISAYELYLLIELKQL